MIQRSTILGLDVHKDTIAVAIADRAGGEARWLGTIPNTPDALARLIRRHGPADHLAVCYEAGPCGYGIYRQLTAAGVACSVVAPGLVPTAPGDRVKTDRRDAIKLARLHRSGELTAIWVPDADHEALRDLTRARDDARHDLQRARQRLSKFLLRHQLSPPPKVNPWTNRYLRWLDALALEHPAHRIVLQEYLRAFYLATERQKRFDAEITALMQHGSFAALWSALQTLRGVGPVTAATIIAELGDLSQFAHPRQLMAFAGLVPREHSSGSRQQRGGITKTGNTHLRHVLVESAWHVRHKPAVSGPLKLRQRDQPAEIIAISWRAQTRLHRRYYRLVFRNKPKQQAVVAVARELVGVIWDVARIVRTRQAEAA